MGPCSSLFLMAPKSGPNMHVSETEQKASPEGCHGAVQKLVHDGLGHLLQSPRLLLGQVVAHLAHRALQLSRPYGLSLGPQSLHSACMLRIKGLEFTLKQHADNALQAEA